METLSSNACFGGTQHVIKHASSSCACDMTFALYFCPPRQQDGPCARFVVFVGPDLHPRKRHGKGRCTSMGRRTRHRTGVP